MIVLKSAGLILFAGLLRFMYLYLQKHLARVGENSEVVLYVIMWLMICNIIITCGIFVYYYYQTEWRLIGKIGKRGPDGPIGNQGSTKCTNLRNNNNNDNDNKCNS
jgi:hypothetical protein